MGDLLGGKETVYKDRDLSIEEEGEITGRTFPATREADTHIGVRPKPVKKACQPLGRCKKFAVLNGASVIDDGNLI